MTTFNDVLNTHTAQAVANGRALTITTLTSRTTILALFTTDAPMLKLHWNEEKGYFVCCGDNCSACIVDKAPRDTFIFPVINLPRKRVEALRVPYIDKPGSLCMEIAAVLADPTQSGKPVQVTKVGNFHYIAEPVPGNIPTETQTLIKDLAEKFKSDLAAGAISLDGLYPRLTAEEIREIPSIHEALKNCGMLDDDQSDDGLLGTSEAA